MKKYACLFIYIFSTTLVSCATSAPTIDQLPDTNMMQASADDTVSRMLRPLI